MLLNDYTDYFPFMVYRTDLLVEPDVLTDGRPSADVSELFPVPLDVDLLSDVTISRELPGETTVLVSTPSEYELAVSASGVYAADGYMYYVLLLSGEDGRQFDASLLPGGGWGVWRFDCESEGEGASERWCVDDQAKISVSMDSAENVLPLAGNASAAKLFLSYDGEAVLLFTAESGELWLTTYDVNSGETRRERLMDAGEAAALGANLSLSGMRGIVEQEGYETFRDAEGAIFSRRAAALRTLTELNFN